MPEVFCHCLLRSLTRVVGVIDATSVPLPVRESVVLFSGKYMATVFTLARFEAEILDSVTVPAPSEISELNVREVQ